ncbi:type II toxin-antitoxin system HicB family antitoxin [Endozoicomonas sp. SM1973]|uniref:Type II toxin-antitoxin system HicB family antitoxin n=1 Tax=Spartinivicinus marinus TaxID=2994442 RepID=A0A853IAV5_9GAMM|nr:type II toxin-antitoxin system HicB family antitoxin [Spartinivicinus marinus]NYZ70473.1 type II toxin-antitoxin system HicB family antitoxin [Spartinivicinus marinus]
MISYKGYIASVTYDEETEVLHGQITNTRDVITFEAENVKDIKLEMQRSIDAHIEFCKSIGREPSTPFSGEFLVRTTPEHHGVFVAAAKESGLSLNKWVDQVLMKEAHKSGPLL